MFAISVKLVISNLIQQFLFQNTKKYAMMITEEICNPSMYVEFEKTQMIRNS